MSTSVELDPSEPIETNSSNQTSEGVIIIPKPRNPVGRKPATAEQLEARAQKKRETTAKRNEKARNALKENSSIKADLEDLKKLLLQSLPQSANTHSGVDTRASSPTSKVEENNKKEVIKEEMKPTNPEMKPPAPKPKVLSKEEKIKMALFGRF